VIFSYIKQQGNYVENLQNIEEKKKREEERTRSV
jgi:hypothetical protein